MKKLDIRHILSATGVLASMAILVAAPTLYALPTADSQLQQQIVAGVLSTDIRDASNVVVPSPSFAMGSVSVSNDQQVSTGTFGSSAQRISIDNPGGANSGWTLALNVECPAVGGGCAEVSKWKSGSDSYSYNGTAAQGQLTVNPAPSTITASTGTTTGITKGVLTAFSGTNPVTLLTASALSDDIWRGYITGVGLSQTIPGSQPVGAYSIDMVQTVTAS